MSLLSIPVSFKEVFKKEIRHLHLNPNWTTQQMLETIVPIIARQLNMREEDVEIVEVNCLQKPSELGPALTKTQQKLKELWTSELDVAFYVRNKNQDYSVLNASAMETITGECPICIEIKILYIRHHCSHRLCNECYRQCENNGYQICPLCRQP